MVAPCSRSTRELGSTLETSLWLSLESTIECVPPEILRISARWGMPGTGRPKAALVLSEDERVRLGRCSRRARSSQALALRSRIVLACVEGADNKTAAAPLGCAEATVGKW